MAIGVVLAGVDRIVILCGSVAVIFEVSDDVVDRVVEWSGCGLFVWDRFIDKPDR